MSRMRDLCDIQCDACGNWHPGIVESIRRQRQLIFRLGWTYIRCDDGSHSDLCPECSGYNKKKATP